MSFELREAAPPAERRPRRLAFYLENLHGGGVQRTTLAVARELAKRGHQVDVLVCRPEGPLADEWPSELTLHPLDRSLGPLARATALAADPAGFPALRRLVFSPRPPRTLRHLPALTRRLRELQPHALLAATPYMNVEAVLAKRLARASFGVVVTEHNDLSAGHPAGVGRHARSLPALCRRAYLQANAVVAVSHGLAAELTRRTGIPADRVTTIHNPVATPELERRSREPLDHPFFAPGEPPVVLAVGRIGRGKDFATLLRAFARLRARRPARLVVLGAGKKLRDKREAELKRLAHKLGIQADVSFPGYEPNPFRYMSRASVLAVSSIYEGFCNVLVEAMACGCPVVSTDCPSGPAEILDHGRFGPLVPPRDDAALAAAIETLLDAPTPAHVLRTRAAWFSVDRAVDRYEALLVGGGSR